MKMRMSGSLPGWLAAVALALAAPAAAQEEGSPEIPRPTAEDLRASREAASEALEVVAVLADPLLEKLGLEAAGARGGATLGEPIPVFNLNLDHLKGLGQGQDPRTLLTRSDEMFYPIAVDGEVVSSVTVVQDGGGWEMTGIGQSHLTAKLIKIQRALELTGEHVAAVDVPALYQMFLVNASTEVPVFIPVYDVPVMELAAMQTIGGGELFDKLKSMAERFESALKAEEEGEPSSGPAVEERR